METKEERRPQKPKKKPPVKITVFIQAFRLYENPNQLNQCTQFNDGKDGGAYGDDKSNYKTNVKLGDWVTWDAYPANIDDVDEGYTVAIDNIVHNPSIGNPNFFNRNVICGKKGVVDVQVVDIDNDGNPDTYTINFSITDPKDETKYYSIDPKLVIIPPGTP